MVFSSSEKAIVSTPVHLHIGEVDAKQFLCIPTAFSANCFIFPLVKVIADIDNGTAPNTCCFLHDDYSVLSMNLMVGSFQ
jgi:hypothetical protein